jgi:SHS2 domain-containing protein
MSYRFLEHTSDIIIESKNKTFENALEDLCQGMFTQMGGQQAKDKNHITITANSPTREQLVVDLLSSIIAECETVPFTPKRAEVVKVVSSKGKKGGLSVTIRLFGERRVPENIIKAVTYHGLRIEENANEWEMEVLFDI